MIALSSSEDALPWDGFDEGNRDEINAMLAPAREVLLADRAALLTMCERHGFAAASDSPWDRDMHDLRWIPHGGESLFLSATHRLGHRLLVILNMPEAMERLLHDHAPVFSLYPTARSVVLAAARIHTVTGPDRAEDRAAQALHDWIYSVEQQSRIYRSMDRGEFAEQVKGRERRRQSIANRHGYSIHKKSGDLIGAGKKTRLPRVKDGAAIEEMMRPRMIDLADPSNHGLGLFAWTLFSAFVHADPIQLLDHIEVTEAVEDGDPRVKTLVATQLNGSRIRIIAILTHNALGDLATTLERTWGWELDDWRGPHTQRTERLHKVYLRPASWSPPWA